MVTTICCSCIPGALQRLTGSAIILMGPIMRLQIGQLLAFLVCPHLGWLGWLSSASHVSHPPACLCKAYFHGNGGAKNCKDAKCFLKSKLRTVNIITLLPTASHKTSFALRNGEIDSASLMRELKKPTAKGQVQGATDWDHWCNHSTTHRKPPLVPSASSSETWPGLHHHLCGFFLASLHPAPHSGFQASMSDNWD